MMSGAGRKSSRQRKESAMRPTHRFMLAVAFVVPASLLLSTAGAEERRTVVAGERYKKSGFHRFLFGAEYRDIWTTPVSLEVLNLGTFAGGLTPTRLIGHGQTQALAFKGADGKSYTFRPSLKDPTGLLPTELRDTVARVIVVDQMASGHPAGAVIVPGLIQPAGILANEPKLVVMPDDPALGEFRGQFANQIGNIEEYTGTKGFGGTTETIDGEEMWKRTRQSPDVRADARQYLKARLVDQMMGDWDRHRDQWRWGKMPDKERWVPMPEDRDQAFVRFEGFVIALLRPQLPLLVKFNKNYSNLKGLTYDGWDVDKRFLAELDKPAWDEVVKELEAAITDDAIDAAARRMPPEYFAKDGPRLIAGLKSRRDQLPKQADRFYRFINREVDIHCTDAEEMVEAQRFANGDLEVSVRAAAAQEPYLKRRYDAKVTHEVRLYLYAGNDKVTVTGGKHGGVLFRVIAGDGIDVLDDSAGGGTHYAASDREDRVVKGPGTDRDSRHFTPPPPNKSGAWIPPRDWGRMTGPLLLLSYGSDLGVLVGGALNTTGYGFRKFPWSDKQTLRLQFSTKETSVRGSYFGQFRLENSRLRFGLYGLGSGIETSRFFGFGNTSTFTGDDKDYRLEQDRFHVEPMLIFSPFEHTDLSLGLLGRYNKTEPRDNPVLNAGSFYGEGAFTQFGVTARLLIDRTGQLALPRKGLIVTGGAAVSPAVGDVEETYGEFHLQARGFLGTKGERGVTLALTAGGQHVFGNQPFFDSAFIGGRTPFNVLEPGSGAAVRGLPPQRYAGDGSLFGGADLYLSLIKATIFVPGTLGLTGFYDTGRVFLAGEDSNKWHYGYGGGLFFTTPGRHNLLSFLVAKSEGNTAFYVRAGLLF
jgi:hypothetical protein